MKKARHSTPAPKRRWLATVLTLLFVLALLMGPGPGVMLVNTPAPVFGFPAIYVWGLVWYVVEVAVVIAAYLFLWSDESDDETT